MAISKNRRRPINLGESRDNRTETTVYRAGAMFIIPAEYTAKKTGLINKTVAKLIRNATKENIAKLEDMGVVCRLGEVPAVGTEERFAN